MQYGVESNFVYHTGFAQKIHSLRNVHEIIRAIIIDWWATKRRYPPYIIIRL